MRVQAAGRRPGACAPPVVAARGEPEYIEAFEPAGAGRGR